jgi:hypothetical protein
MRLQDLSVLRPGRHDVAIGKLGDPRCCAVTRTDQHLASNLVTGTVIALAEDSWIGPVVRLPGHEEPTVGKPSSVGVSGQPSICWND